jgi:hypothetical protein|tara:strand:+ start:141 stop:569 length:429 start_codon:yes stop_codon:yes gene_type:complete
MTKHLIKTFAFAIVIYPALLSASPTWDDHVSLECTQVDGERIYQYVLLTDPPSGTVASSYGKDLTANMVNTRFTVYPSPLDIKARMTYCRDGSEKCTYEHWGMTIDRATLKGVLRASVYKMPDITENYTCKVIPSLMDSNKI